MWPVATDGNAWSVCLCACLSVDHVRKTYKMAEPMNMPFGLCD